MIFGWGIRGETVNVDQSLDQCSSHSFYFDRSNDFIHNPTLLNRGETVNVNQIIDQRSHDNTIHEVKPPFCDNSINDVLKSNAEKDKSSLSPRIYKLPLPFQFGEDNDPRFHRTNNDNCENRNFTVPVVTRAKARQDKLKLDHGICSQVPMSGADLVSAQKSDPSISYCYRNLVNISDIDKHKRVRFTHALPCSS